MENESSLDNFYEGLSCWDLLEIYISGERRYSTHQQLEDDHDYHECIALHVCSSDEEYSEVSASIDASYQWYLLSFGILGPS
jgi:hypothetical protein